MHMTSVTVCSIIQKLVLIIMIEWPTHEYSIIIVGLVPRMLRFTYCSISEQ